MNEIEEVLIRDDMIRLGQFIKLANLVEDGAQAREVIQNGLVKVNGDIEEARGKQLHDGDVVELNGFAARVTVENSDVLPKSPPSTRLGGLLKFREYVSA